MTKKIYLFFGPPGSGKGTQSDILGRKLKLPVISPGELLRHEIEKKSKIGLTVQSSMSQGKLVSDGIIEKMLDKRLAKPDTKKGFIMDGYPRREQQLVFLKRKLKKILKPGDKLMAINIDVSDKEVKKRVTGRRVCDCGAAYHLQYNPPKKIGRCDLCGKKLEQREDDKPKIVKERLHYYHHVIKSIIHYFRDAYVLLNINGERSIKIIEKEILSKVKATK